MINLQLDCNTPVSPDKIVVYQFTPYNPNNVCMAWSISLGNTGNYFVITPCGGVLKVKNSVYGSFYRSKTFTLGIKSTDEDGSYILKKWKIILTKDSQGRPLPIAPPILA
jgi:hypothetical protein